MAQSSESSKQPLSPGVASNFRQSIHLIPTPGLEQPRPKRIDPLTSKWYVLGPVTLLMFGLGLALEVALVESNKRHGFHVPAHNIFAFASTSFLTSFFPILLVAPLGFLWITTDYTVKRFQPYVALARGNATAEDSLLLDYLSLNRFVALWSSIRRRHWIVVVSGLTGLGALLIQPLAGAIFSVTQSPDTISSTALSTQTIGLDPNIGQLYGFLGAAGYVDAAVVNHLPDPPFVEGGWAAANFQFPSGIYTNGSLAVNTTGIRTNVSCTVASTQLATPSTGSYTLAASSAGCNATVAINPADAVQQYGVSPVPNCGPTAAAGNTTFLPVFFWFYHVQANNTPQAAGVLCQPTIGTFNILATSTIGSSQLTNVTIIGPVNTTAFPTNVTGAPLNGLAFNGVIFDEPNADAFVQARATAIAGAVPGAIFRAAMQLPGNGLQATFNAPTGFLNLTNVIYTQHLSVAAKSVYFLTTNQTLPANLTSLQPRLSIEPLAAHGLSFVLFSIGLVGLFVQAAHRRARRDVQLASFPGTIANAVSLTAHAGFGQLLFPYDDEAGMRRKLSGLRFRLDPRTGAIVAQDGAGDVDRNIEEANRSALLQRDVSLTGSGYEIEPLEPHRPLSSPYDEMKNPHDLEA